MSENRNDHYNSPKPQMQYVFCFHKAREKQHLASLLLPIQFLLIHLLNHYHVSFRHQDGLWENNKAVRYIRVQSGPAGSFY